MSRVKDRCKTVNKAKENNILLYFENVHDVSIAFKRFPVTSAILHVSEGHPLRMQSACDNYAICTTCHFLFSKFALYLLYKVGERLAVREIGVAAGQSGSSPRPSRVEVL